MKFNKRDVRKIKNATKEDLDRLRKEYEALMKNINGMSPIGLMLISVVGIAVILFFQSNLLDFVGLIVLLYPLYILIQRIAHREGYFEGYYDMMTKTDHRADHESPENHNQK